MRYKNGRVNARKEKTTGRHIEKINEPKDESRKPRKDKSTRKRKDERRSRGEDKGDKEESGWKEGGQRIGQFSLKISYRRGARRKREWESGRGEVVARERDCRKAEKERDDVG